MGINKIKAILMYFFTLYLLFSWFGGGRVRPEAGAVVGKWRHYHRRRQLAVHRHAALVPRTGDRWHPLHRHGGHLSFTLSIYRSFGGT